MMLRLIYMIGLVVLMNSAHGQSFAFYLNHYALQDSINSGQLYVVVDQNDTINRVDSHGRMQGEWRVKYWNDRRWIATFIDNMPNGEFVLSNSYRSLIKGNYSNGHKSGIWFMDVPFSKPDTMDFDTVRIPSLDSIIALYTNYCIGFTRKIDLTGTNYLSHPPKSINEYACDSNHIAQLDLIADALQTNSTLALRLTAFCGIDRSNPGMFSIVQSEKGLQSLKNYLMDKGIDEARIELVTNEDTYFDFLIERYNVMDVWWNNRIEVRFSDH